MNDFEMLDTGKVPTSKNKYVGIEIEFLTTRGPNIVKLKKLLIEDDLQWNCNLGSDGSVKDTTFVPKIVMRPHINWRGESEKTPVILNEEERKWGYELRILAQENEAPEIVNRVCDIISECDGIINTTCGLHVHVDLRNRDYETVYNNMFMVQNLMFKTQPKSRTTGNKYCRKLIKMFGPKSRAGRYHAINRAAYKAHRTIEIRLHEPTLVAKEILMWTGFLIDIANIETKLTKKISVVEDLPWLDEKLKGYLNERIEKYSRKSNTKTA
jgi:hypothetical protein